MSDSFTLDDILDYSLPDSVFSTVIEKEMELTEHQFIAMRKLAENPATTTSDAILPRSFNIVLP